MSDFIFLQPHPTSSNDFPTDVLKWMKINAKPKMAFKLMKCHKYFQHSEFPYFVVKDVSIGFCNPADDNYDEWILTTLDNKEHFYKGFESFKNIPKMLWLIDSISISHLPNFTSNFIYNIAVCDIKDLYLQDQKLTFDDFIFLASSNLITHINLYDTVITYENGDPVFVDQLIKLLPNVEEILIKGNTDYHFSPNFNVVFQEINTTKLKSIRLDMTSYLDFEKLSKFININPHVHFDLSFTYASLSDEEKLSLEKYVQQIIDNGVTKFCPPWITFPGQPHEQYDALCNIMQLYLDQKNNARKNVV